MLILHLFFSLLFLAKDLSAGESRVTAVKQDRLQGACDAAGRNQVKYAANAGITSFLDAATLIVRMLHEKHAGVDQVQI